MTEESPAEAISAAIRNLLDEFSRLQADVAALQKKSADIDHLTRTFDKKVDELAQSAAEAAAEARQTRERVDRLTDLVSRDQAIRAARDELAGLQRELDGDYAAHEDVRRLARTIIRDAEDGILNGQALLAQAHPADVPGYWLSGASIAVLAWAAGDRNRYEAAIRRALTADEARTALFMALTLRHYSPGEATRRWITRYLSALRPGELPADFQVLVDGLTRGAFGDVSPRVLFDQLSRWYHEEADEAEARAQWDERLAGLGKPADAAVFPVLARRENAWAELSERHEAATACTVAGEHFPGRFAAGSPVPANLSDRVSSLLRTLVDTPVTREAEVHRRARWLRALIDSDADRAAADQATAQEESDPVRSRDLVSLVNESAFTAQADQEPGAASVTELLAIWLSAGLIADAAGRLDARWPRPAEVTVAAGPTPLSIAFSSSTDASVAPDAIDVQVSARTASATATVAKEAERQRRRLRLPTRAAQAALPAGVILAGVAAAPTGDPRIDFIVPAVVLAVPSIAWLAWLPRMRKRLARGTDEATRRVREDIRAAGEELKFFFERELAGKAQLAKLQEFLRALGPADVEASAQKVTSSARPRPADFPDWSPFPPGQPGSS